MQELHGLATLDWINTRIAQALDHLRNGRGLLCLHGGTDWTFCLAHVDLQLVDCVACHDRHRLDWHLTRHGEIACGPCEGGMAAVAERTWGYDEPFRCRAGGEGVVIDAVDFWTPLCGPHLLMFERDSETFAARLAQRN